MIARHSLIYVGSRGVAAALNMASVAVFTRLAPAQEYGTYLYLMSWALVLYGATCQWPKFAFFALYEEARAQAQIGTVVRILGGSLLLAGLAAWLAAALGLIAAPAAGAIVALAVGFTLFEGSTEVARTRLKAGAVAAAVLCRAVLMLALGSAVLRATGDPLDLALAIAAANALGALPTLVTMAPMLRGGGSRTEARRLLAYGWPLVLSFGTAALAQSLDRLIIAKTVGPAGLGAYGAIADFLRQSFIVFGEALALSLMSIAKREARIGGMAAASGVLCDAARAMTAIAAFGAVFFLCFDDLVVAILLGPGYREEARRLAPVLILASILMMFRAYYFGQVIYFTRTSRLEAAAAFATLVTVAAVSLLLIPTLGAFGAALAFAGGQAAACLVLIVGARRAGTAMPLPLPDMGGIAAAAGAVGLAIAGIGLLPGGTQPPGQALRILLLGAAFLAVAWRIDMLGLAGAIRRRLTA
ncbi:lipopolysaccharide biosynthesis protein [Methylobacterium sp. J-076]|uniref:lipopolysaccharide biosynthesis protein n=1 Tax=Methylobacterium sp. J-076 TaxID=2836655 RepID=UPI001FB9CFE0|nr:oligosaccharide flippase family protein [Methylobacterium sp. J-076]MCJ2011332.1 oligosaccharide flippase family protein [Methylobacterium sp. J-076]